MNKYDEIDQDGLEFITALTLLRAKLTYVTDLIVDIVSNVKKGNREIPSEYDRDISESFKICQIYIDIANRKKGDYSPNVGELATKAEEFFVRIKYNYNAFETMLLLGLYNPREADPLEKDLIISCAEYRDYYFSLKAVEYERSLSEIVNIGDLDDKVGTILSELKGEIKTITKDIESKGQQYKEIINDIEDVKINFKSLLGEGSRLTMSDFFQNEAKGYKRNSIIFLIIICLLFIGYPIFQGWILYQHKSADFGDYFLKLSFIPIFLALILFLISQYNKNKNLYDEYMHKKVVILSMKALESDVNSIPDESRSLYYNSLFQAINRSPVEMLTLSKNKKNDDNDVLKILALLNTHGR